MLAMVKIAFLSMFLTVFLSKYMMNFQITDDQQDKIVEWLNTLPEIATGAIGGRLTYQFTPTSIGLVTKVIDGCTKEELDLTDHTAW